MKRRILDNRKKKLFTKRFFPAGNYTWTVPPGCTEVDVFLVGGGGSSIATGSGTSPGGGGGGYTKTFRGKGYIEPSSGTWDGSYNSGRDGNTVSVTSGQVIPIIVGKGGDGSNGGYSQFLNSAYRAGGGYYANIKNTGASGGSGGASVFGSNSVGGSDGSDGDPGGNAPGRGGYGQGHTTRDFGEPTGKRNAGGGSAFYYINGSYPAEKQGGISDYTEGKGANGVSGGCGGGGGYGGGAGAENYRGPIKGGDGTVLIRYYAYEE